MIPLHDVCEIVRMHVWDRVHLALDYFDSSVNRISAWINGARSTQEALLYAFLDYRTDARCGRTRRLWNKALLYRRIKLSAF